ncbi:MAG TPA: hypothetical protein VLE93_00570 [Candidatus Saccharimonadales bacterium]|nr:hypothetical protein [Candidatus Saccharimonadales bacterium]
MKVLQTFWLVISGMVACWLYSFLALALSFAIFRLCGANWPSFPLLLELTTFAVFVIAVCAWDDEEKAVDFRDWWFYLLRHQLPPVWCWRLVKWLAKRAKLVPI